MAIRKHAKPVPLWWLKFLIEWCLRCSCGILCGWRLERVPKRRGEAQDVKAIMAETIDVI